MSIPAATGPMNLPKFDIVKSIPIPKETFELFSISPINDLLDGNSKAQPRPEKNDKDSKCQTSIKFVIIKINAIRDEVIKISVEKFIKISYRIYQNIFLLLIQLLIMGQLLSQSLMLQAKHFHLN